jgi:guanine nucleotide-binding protein subunit alpha
MEIDTASLVVHRDTDSIITRMTDNLSKLSAVFSFDRELFVSKVYERALRGSVKESLKVQQGDLEARKRSQAIDRKLKIDSKQLRRAYKVLLLGSGDSGKEQLVKYMKINGRNGYTVEELMMYRPTIYKNVIDSVKCLIEAMQQFEIEPEIEANRELCNLLMDYTLVPDPKEPLEKTIGDAICSICKDSCVSKVMIHSSEFYMMDSAP